ncbi:MAG: DUF4286 family protein [Bacteroidota bacterium]
MILYSVFVAVPFKNSEEWLRWMLDIHIPDVLKTGMFTSFTVFKNLAHDMEDEVEFCIQYTAESLENYERYKTEFAPELQKHHTEKFGNIARARRAVLEKLAP